MKLTLKNTPPSLNKFAGRENSWEYRNTKLIWTEAVCWASKPYRPPTPYEHASVTITYYFPTRARHDADNYCGKFLLDGLTKAGIIADDDMKHITLTIKGEYDKANPRTVIEVTETERRQINA